MRPTELENESRLAGSREDGVKEPSPGLHPLAGFDLTPEVSARPARDTLQECLGQIAELDLRRQEAPMPESAEVSGLSGSIQ